MAAAVQMPPTNVDMESVMPSAPIDPALTMTSLYVGDLNADVTEAMLFETFNKIAAVASMRICRDHLTRRSLRYGYVNFHNHEDAKRALEELNFEELLGKPMRISWSNRDPSSRRSGEGNIFIKNLSKSIDSKNLWDTFNQFGAIMSCKVATDENGESKGYGFVHFVQPQDADRALEAVNGMLIDGQEVTVARFLPKKDRQAGGGKEVQFTNVYVNNLPEAMLGDELSKLFSKFGTITSSLVRVDESGKSRQFGFVNFEKPENAAKAVEEMNGKEVDGSTLFVGRAQKKNERRQMLEQQHLMMRKEREAKTQGVNLYIKHLDENIDDDFLRSTFEKFGTITSVKVMRDNKGNSRGFGFVCFSAPEEATKAMTEMNSKVIGTKPLYIAPAQRKEERLLQISQRQQAHFRNAMMPYHQPPMNMFGQMPMPMQMGYRFPPMAARGGRFPMAMGPQRMMPMMPQMVPQGQPQQQGRRGGRGGSTRGGPARNKYNQRPMQMGAMGQDENAASADFSSLLLQAPEKMQKQMLGERLYPLIQQQYGDLAGKITGMLLAMDNSELLHLLDDESALKEKAAEAQRVLEEYRKKDESNQQK